MHTPQYERYAAYVQRTSLPKTRETRMSIFRELDGQTHASVSGLLRAIGGNTKTRDWVSQAIKDGEIVQREDGRLVLPSHKRAPEQLTIPRAKQILAHVAELTRDYYTLEEHSDLWWAMLRINGFAHEPENARLQAEPDEV